MHLQEAERLVSFVGNHLFLLDAMSMTTSVTKDSMNKLPLGWNEVILYHLLLTKPSHVFKYLLKGFAQHGLG